MHESIIEGKHGTYKVVLGACYLDIYRIKKHVSLLNQLKKKLSPLAATIKWEHVYTSTAPIMPLSLVELQAVMQNAVNEYERSSLVKMQSFTVKSRLLQL
jgi:hypothetical protein